MFCLWKLFNGNHGFPVMFKGRKNQITLKPGHMGDVVRPSRSTIVGLRETDNVITAGYLNTQHLPATIVKLA